MTDHHPRRRAHPIALRLTAGLLACLLPGVLLSQGRDADPAAPTPEWPPFVDCAQATVAPQPEDLRVAAVGDLVFSERPELNRDAFRSVMPLLLQADFAFGNLEGAITEHTEATKRYVPGRSYAFRFPLETADLLRQANIGAVSIANNHSNDFGPRGFADTRRQLERVGIAATGEPGSFLVRELRGVRVALVAFGHSTRFNNILDLPEAARVVARARAAADTVIVTHQGGAEGDAAVFLTGAPEIFLGEQRGDVRAFARTVIEAGASLVVGHGPHVLRAAECVGSAAVLHSIGNFVSVGGLSVASLANVSAMLEALFDAGGALRGVRLIPVTFRQERLPLIDPTGRALHLVNALGERAAVLPDFRPMRFPGYESGREAYRQWATTIPVLR